MFIAYCIKLSTRKAVFIAVLLLDFSKTNFFFCFFSASVSTSTLQLNIYVP
jgi:hypothetical protein